MGTFYEINHLTKKDQITAIIPTLCEAVRHDSLLRAIDSLLGQTVVPAKIIIVVNGDLFDHILLEELQRRPDLEVCYRPEANVGGARYAALDRVDTEFFCFLDDDDEYLPDALSIRLAAITGESGIDVVVSNGYRILDGEEILVCANMLAIERDPIGSLVRYAWLTSCAGLYRTHSIGSEFFGAESRYLEWTYLAFLLALTKRIAFVQEPTYRIHDSPGSVSKSEAYRRAGPEVLKAMLAFEIDPAIRRAMRLKYVDVLHALSDHYRKSGEMGFAWAYHVRSLGAPAGFLRYLAYTRKLLLSRRYCKYRR